MVRVRSYGCSGNRGMTELEALLAKCLLKQGCDAQILPLNNRSYQTYKLNSSLSSTTFTLSPYSSLEIHRRLFAGNKKSSQICVTWKSLQSVMAMLCLATLSVADSQPDHLRIHQQILYSWIREPKSKRSRKFAPERYGKALIL